MNSRIVVIGSCLTATVAFCRRMPVGGETVVADRIYESLGGKGLDMAIQAARLGASVVFIGVVGDDAAGSVWEAALRDAGVRTDYLVRLPGKRTGHGVILREEDGSNVIAVDPRATRAFSPEVIDAAGDVFDTRTVVLTQLEIPLQTALHGCRMAHRFGATTILNPAPAQDLRNQSLSCVDFLTPNETEAPVCVGAASDGGLSDHRQSAEQMLVAGCRAVIVTRGSDGSVLYRKATPPVSVPAFAVEAVDTTGSGDSYNASLAVALSDGTPIERAMREASAASALSCTREGTVTAYPDRPAVSRFLGKSS